MHENEIARIVVDSSFKIHSAFGPGLLESIYEKLLRHELVRRGLDVRCQISVPVFYEEIPLGIGFRADLIVDEKLIIEVKSVERIAPVHLKQLRTYLLLTEKKTGPVDKLQRGPDKGRDQTGCEQVIADRQRCRNRTTLTR